jgi:acetyltransferase-like isoleucine patch superfamily enzyme
LRRHIRNVISVLCSMMRLLLLKLFYGKRINAGWIQRISPNVVIEVNRGGMLTLGKHTRIHSGCKLKIRKSGKLSLGDNVKINYNCMFFCHDSIEIGSGCEFGPNVLIYDHDHDFHCKGGVKNGTFLHAPVNIGKDCWIGANTVILRGTEISDGSVIAAGSIVKGCIPSGSLYLQKRNTEISAIII